MDKSSIYEQFATYCWVNNKQPESIAAFCDFAKIEHTTFTEHFSSFDQLRSCLLIETLEKVWDNVEATATQHEYSGREKALALFFTLAEKFGPYKRYFQTLYPLKQTPAFVQDWRGFNQQFVRHTQYLNPDERMQWLRDKLPNTITNEANGLLIAWNYVFRVWLADESEDQATTDAAIEKTIHLYFDFANTDKLEQLMDFGKFIFSTKVRL
jgi:hypothetical protein